jgi:predicted nucleic acid-binding protein
VTRAVFDASVLVKVVVPESGTPAAVAALSSCDERLTPDWAMLECAHALWRKAHLGTHSADLMRLAFEGLKRADLTLVPSESLAEAAFAIACELDHPVYDCAYIALALAEGAALVTADAVLADVSERAGIPTQRISSDE